MSAFDKDSLIAQLERHEGFVSHAYQDHLGFWTIGIGRLIDERKGGGITKEEAAYLLGNDLKRIEADLDRRAPWWRELSPIRQQALMNMAFQLGVSGLLAFRNACAAMRAMDWDRAAAEMLNSRWAEQTPGRAKELAAMMRLDIPHKGVIS